MFVKHAINNMLLSPNCEQSSAPDAEKTLTTQPTQAVSLIQKTQEIEVTQNEQILLKKINRTNLPQHIAIIMDGNGRWAGQRGWHRSLGHRAGMASLKKVVRLCCDLKIKVLTVYSFSTENWNRPQEEVNGLMDLVVEYLTKEIDELCDLGVRLNPIGLINELPTRAKQALAKSTERSQFNEGLIFNLALNYGGRTEITNAMKIIAQLVQAGTLTVTDINMQTITDYLYTAGQPDPDLLIRTSGDFRLSNFLLWQLAYTEIWVSDVLWPDFERVHLLQAILDYQMRERRFGSVK